MREELLRIAFQLEHDGVFGLSRAIEKLRALAAKINEVDPPVCGEPAAPPSQPVALSCSSRYEWREGRGIFDTERGTYLLLGDDEHARILWRALTSQPVALPEPAFRLTWRDGQYRVSKPNIGNTDCYTADQVMSMLAAAPEVPRG